MKDNKVMENLLDMVCKELETISDKKALDAASLANLDKLIDIKKDILEVMRMESGQMSEGGYSEMSRPHYYGSDRGYVIQPYHSYNPRMGYSRSEGEMSQYLRSMASNMPQPKRDMVYDFVNRLESM